MAGSRPWLLEAKKKIGRGPLSFFGTLRTKENFSRCKATANYQISFAFHRTESFWRLTPAMAFAFGRSPREKNFTQYQMLSQERFFFRLTAKCCYGCNP